ncbi:MAG: cardiolipin synthase [Steroidobacteraceae bacterium]
MKSGLPVSHSFHHAGWLQLSCNAKCSVKRIAVLLSIIGVSVISACASLPNVSDDSQKVASPVLGNGRRLNEATASHVIQNISGAATSEARTEVDKLADAVRRETRSPFLLGNKVRVLVDGPETFAHIRQHIDRAHSSIHVETYIFADDKLGQDFAGLLAEKARQGVEVRVIFDALGSATSASEMFERMRQAGVQVEAFHPLTPLRTLPWRYNNRDHRKLLVIDGKVAFTGGLNISSTYSSGSVLRPGPERGMDEGWRDTHAQIEGPAVRMFQALFFETWVGLGGQVANDSGKYFPMLAEIGTDIVSAVASTGVKQRDEAIYTSYLAAIDNASRRIWITQAYFSPPEDLRDALIAAVRRGVDVRILLPGFTDSTLVFHAARAGYTKLLEGGVRLFEVTDALLHAKTALIDNSLSVIGSANLDYRSFLHNNEITAVIISESLAERMQQIFLADSMKSREISLKDWRKRPFKDRIKESFSRLFNYWL